MRDAIGGVVAINVIIFFLFLISGYLAYSVNYTKAFRAKNEIINIIEEYEGFTSDAKTKINEKLRQQGYQIPATLASDIANSGYCCNRSVGYCISATPSGTSIESGDDDYRGWVYSVVTFVNIDVPVLNKVLPLMGRLLQVKGETRSVYTEGNDSQDFHSTVGNPTCANIN